MLLGFGLMAACLLALDRVTIALPGHAAARARVGQLDAPDRERLSAVRRADSAAAPRRPRGAVSAVHGARRRDWRSAERRLFDLVGGYRPLFLMMAGYTALAFVAVLFVPRGAGEADTGAGYARGTRASADASASSPRAQGLGTGHRHRVHPTYTLMSVLAGIDPRCCWHRLIREATLQLILNGCSQRHLAPPRRTKGRKCLVDILHFHRMASELNRSRELSGMTPLRLTKEVLDDGWQSISSRGRIRWSRRAWSRDRSNGAR